jgi:hypothetical protein
MIARCTSVVSARRDAAPIQGLTDIIAGVGVFLFRQMRVHFSTTIEACAISLPITGHRLALVRHPADLIAFAL